MEFANNFQNRLSLFIVAYLTSSTLPILAMKPIATNFQVVHFLDPGGL